MREFVGFLMCMFGQHAIIIKDGWAVCDRACCRWCERLPPIEGVNAMEPSPTPWHLFDNGTEIWAQGPPDAPVIVVADTQLAAHPTPKELERAQADAARIVESVNGYEHLRNQIDRLAQWILANVHGEPSQSEGAVDTAIRLLSQR